MASNLLGFSSPKERDDFFIALAVIIFFGFLFYWFAFRGNGETDKSGFVAFDDEAVGQVSGLEDTDGDGIPDIEDSCPDLAGILAYNGCPKTPDLDNDGIPNEEDQCPTLKGPRKNMGCPEEHVPVPYTPLAADSVMKGITRIKAPVLPDITKQEAEEVTPDEAEAITEIPEEIIPEEVPEEVPLVDTDADGVPDEVDRCPEKPGIPANNGCPEVVLEEEERQALDDAIQTVDFRLGSARLRSSSPPVLYKIIGIMKKYPDYQLEIIGHTDNEGSPQRNLELSIERAQACYDYIRYRGVDADRITFKGMGETKPIADNETEEGRELNRRVEFIIK